MDSRKMFEQENEGIMERFQLSMERYRSDLFREDSVTAVS